jgi:hypothetical protein
MKINELGIEQLLGAISNEAKAATPKKVEVKDVKISPSPEGDDVHVEVLLDNSHIVCVKRLDLKDFFQELYNTFVTSMQAKGVNSIATHHFGILAKLNIVPKGSKVSSYKFCNAAFYEISDFSREAHVYDMVVKAASTSPDDSFMLPFVTKTTVPILVSPRNWNSEGSEDKYMDLEIDTLTLTQDEVKFLNFGFIRKIELISNLKSKDKYMDARFKFTVDKDLLSLAPYSKTTS